MIARETLLKAYLIHRPRVGVRGVRHRDVLPGLDVEQLQLLSQLGHVGDGDGDVADDKVVVLVDGRAAFNQVEVKIAKGQPGSMSKNKDHRIQNSKTILLTNLSKFGLWTCFIPMMSV